MLFTNIDLDNAEIAGEELNKLSYSPDDYPAIDDVIEGVLINSYKEPVTLDPKVLSVNGRVSADKMERYLASPSLSSSSLKEVIKNPAAFYFYINDKGNFIEKPKPHLELGTFFHSAFLEPKLFDRVVVEPEANKASLEGVSALVSFWEKLIWDSYKYKGVADKKINQAMVNCEGFGGDVKKINGQRIYLDCLKDISGFTAIQANHKLIIDLVKRHYYSYGGGIIPMLLKGAQVEHSFYGTDPVTGLKVKVRPDAFNTEENIGVNAIISFKTTAAADMGKFIYDSAKFKYELSEGMYQEVMSNVTGRNFNVTIMVVLQTVAPYLPAVFFWDAEDLVNGKYKYRYALDTIKDCQDKGLYPGFESLAESGHYGIIQMKQPGWAEKLLSPIDLED
jgi:hypothetical protein